MRARLAGVAAATVLVVGCRPQPTPRLAFVGVDRVGAAAALAVADVNAAGGIDGRRLVLDTLLENGVSGRVAIEHALRLTAQPEIVAVIGHANSGNSVAAAQIYNSAGLTQLAPNTSAPTFGQAGPYSFRLIPADDRQAEFLVRQIPARARPRIAVAYSIGDYGRGLHRELLRRLQARWLEPVLQTSFTDPLDSAQAELLPVELARARPELLFWLGQPDDLARVLPALRRQLGALRVYAPDAFDAAVTYGELRRPLAGVRFVRFFDPTQGGPAYQRLRARFARATGSELTYDAVMTYDAVLLVARAMREGHRTRPSLRRYVAEVGRGRPGLEGAGGRVAFNEERDALRPYLLAEVTPAGVRALQAR